MRKLGWVYRDRIIWYKQKFNGSRPAAGSTTASNSRVQRNWEYILVFHKGIAKLEGDAKKLGDLNSTESQQWQNGFWDITAVTTTKKLHRCPFPPELPQRLIKRLCFRGDIVLDPFSGSGTTCWVANGLGRRYVGIDNDPVQIEASRERMKTPYIEPETIDPYIGIDPKKRVSKLVSFKRRQAGEDLIARVKRDNEKKTGKKQ